MAVEAARDALGDSPRSGFRSLVLATTRAPFADLQCASIVAGALALPDDAQTRDVGRSQRAGVSGLLSELQGAAAPDSSSPATTRRQAGQHAGDVLWRRCRRVHARHRERDRRTHRQREPQQRLRRPLPRRRTAATTTTGRSAGSATRATRRSFPTRSRRRLAEAGRARGDMRHFVLASSLKGIGDMVARKCGIAPQALADALDESCGYAGAAHRLPDAGARRSNRRRRASLLLVVGFGQGGDVLVLRVTEAIASFKPRRGVSGALADALVHRQLHAHAVLRRRASSSSGACAPRRGQDGAHRAVPLGRPDRRASSPDVARHCGTVQFPQLAYCVSPECHAPAAAFEQLRRCTTSRPRC